MSRLSPLFSGVAAVALFAMMALTFADVFSRKFLGNSITGAVELTELCMLAMIFFALPLASAAGEHIVFDLLDRLLPRRVLHWQQRIAHVVVALVLAGAAWVVAARAARTLEFGDETAALGIRLGPFHYGVAVLLALTALVHLALAARTPAPPADAAPTPPEVA